MRLRPLRDCQVRPVDEMVAACREAHSALLVSPCGSGKTDMGLHIAARLAEGSDDPILWCAPSIDLVDQAIERVRLAGVEPRVLQAGDRGSASSPVIVATVPTLLAMLRRGEALPRPSVVVHDEARCHLAPEWRTVGEALSAAASKDPFRSPLYRVALDATPSRTDGTPMRDLAARIVRGPEMRELQGLGFLVPVIIRSPDSRGDKLAADPARAYEKMLGGQRAIVYCRDIAHAEGVASEIRRRGYRCEAVHQERTKAERRAAMEAFRAGPERGGLHVLTNIMTLFQGVDVPELAGVVLARGISTDEAWIQIGGRVARACPAAGKTHGLVVDLHGCFHDFGWIETRREYSLDGQGMRRAEPLPPAVQCRKCLGWGPGGGVCELCKVPLPPPPPPKVLARDLIEMRAAADDDDKRAATLLRLVRGVLARGKNPWQAKHIYRGTYGVDPTDRALREAIKQAQEEGKAA